VDHVCFQEEKREEEENPVIARHLKEKEEKEEEEEGQDPPPSEPILRSWQVPLFLDCDTSENFMQKQKRICMMT